MASSTSERRWSSCARRERTLTVSAFTGRERSSFTRDLWATDTQRNLNDCLLHTQMLKKCFWRRTVFKRLQGFQSLSFRHLCVSSRNGGVPCVSPLLLLLFFPLHLPLLQTNKQTLRLGFSFSYYVKDNQMRITHYCGTLPFSALGGGLSRRFCKDWDRRKVVFPAARALWLTKSTVWPLTCIYTK